MSATQQPSSCQGSHFAGICSRRQLLQGGLGAGLSLSIPFWQQRSRLQAGVSPSRPYKQCILLWMNGGPSHLDTFDPKPGTREGGPFRSIKTRIPGVEISEHLPRVAEQAHQMAILRSMTSKEGNHDRGQYLMHTGYIPAGSFRHPSLGAWVSHERTDVALDLPHFVSINGPSIGAGFLGVEHQPYTVLDPKNGMNNVAYPKDLNASRFSRRQEAFAFLQGQFQQQTQLPAVASQNKVYQQATSLMHSPLVSAFDLEEETSQMRAKYGEHDFGRGCLMARRLIESGVPFVEVMLDGWDTHYDNFAAIEHLLGLLDPAMSTLLEDLDQRDLLDDTLVIWMGEFGRTPRISANDGRDHYPAAWSAVLAGGGVRAGQAYGATDEIGAKVVRDAVTVPNFFATVATLLGMDPDKEVYSPQGRPIRISDSGTPIHSLIA
ncbi:DUF1501 domain-containing protein [Planctomycetales bacterium 10988]|nr:DUF1501 domain-containing protein [Planctomycetales bacterium 10988]